MIFVLFSRVVSRTRNRPVSKYSRCRIGLPSVLRRRLWASEDSSSVPRTTDHHIVRVWESLRDPRNLIRSRTPVRSPAASSHVTIISRQNTSTKSDLRVVPPRSRCASDSSTQFCVLRSPNITLLSKVAMRSRYVSRTSSSSQRGDHALCGGDTYPRLYAKSSHTSKNTCVHARSSRCRITMSANSFVATRESLQLKNLNLA